MDPLAKYINASADHLILLIGSLRNSLNAREHLNFIYEIGLIENRLKEFEIQLDKFESNYRKYKSDETNEDTTQS